MSAVRFWLALVVTVTAFGVGVTHADHVDNHIWIETADGDFITATKTALVAIQDIDDGEIVISSHYHERYTCDVTVTGIKQSGTGGTVTLTNWDDWTRPRIESINGIQMLNQRSGECGDTEAEERHLIDTINRKGSIKDWEMAGGTTVYPHQQHHQCVCGYWYSNTIKDGYTYTIVGLPGDRELPAGYGDVVAAGVAAGLDRWGDINGIDFTHVDNPLADIIIQQRVGDGRIYGNAQTGCLFDNQHCTIRLYTDLNEHGQQTLVNSRSIEWTIAHEFGHLIGLPHHLEPGHIMNTMQYDDAVTYYNVRNMNVPEMAEPIYEQRLLGNGTMVGQLRAEYDGIVDKLFNGGGLDSDDLAKLLGIVETLFGMLEP